MSSSPAFRDHLAPPEVVDTYRGLSSTRSNLEMHIVAGAAHGFMMRSRATAFHADAFALAMSRALAILIGLQESSSDHRAAGGVVMCKQPT